MAQQLTQIVPAQQAVKNIRTFLEDNKGQIGMALPKHLTADRLLRIALTSIQKTPKLLECTPISLFGAILQSAQLGLIPDGMTGEAYLVPFYNTKKQCQDVQLIPGYRGLLKLVRQSGQLSTFFAAAVHAHDAFEYELGLNPILRHRPFDGEGDPGALTHVYAIARMKDGGVQFEVMTKAQVDEVRMRSKAADSGPWVTDYEQMAKKTVTRRITKYLPASAELMTAVTLDEQAERNIPQDLDKIVDFGAQDAPFEDKPAAPQQEDVVPENDAPSPPPPPPAPPVPQRQTFAQPTVQGPLAMQPAKPRATKTAPASAKTRSF